jgi:5'-nucleotidase
MEKKIILVDMDGPLAQFEETFLKEWKKMFPKEPHIPLRHRRKFYPRDEYPEKLRPKVEQIYKDRDFYPKISPVEEGLRAMRDMLALGIEVFICTTPLSFYYHCVFEKYDWVERHLGYEFTKRLILTRDKTLIRGDLLIDDKPEITGIQTPAWEHIIYDFPYNRRITGKRRLVRWKNWREILKI